MLGYGVELKAVRRPLDASGDSLCVIDHGLLRSEDIAIGRISAASGGAAREYVISATKAALAGDISAMVTLPMNKEATQLSDPGFVGHTELIGSLCGSKDVTIMLVPIGSLSPTSARMFPCRAQSRWSARLGFKPSSN